jgi:hypothetical protein
MHDWMKKNKKKLLAVLGAFLMVSFLITVPMSSLTSGSGRQARGEKIGTLGKNVWYQQDRRRASMLWKLLEGSYSDVLRNQLDRQFGLKPDDLRLARQMGQVPRNLVSPVIGLFDPENLSYIVQFARMQPEFVGQIIRSAEDRGILREIKDHPELFLLLVKDAEQHGIAITDDRLQTELTNDIRPDIEKLGTFDQELYKEAVRDFLMVQALRDQVLSDAKYTQPEWEQYFAKTCRVERLTYVDFGIDEPTKTIGPVPTTRPTTQQVQEQYDKFKKDEPGKPGPANPFGFGYFLPDRVKLAYFTVSREDALEYLKEKKVGYKNGNWLPEFDLALRKKVWDEYFKNKPRYLARYNISAFIEQARKDPQAALLHKPSLAGVTGDELFNALREVNQAEQKSEQDARFTSLGFWTRIFNTRAIRNWENDVKRALLTMEVDLYKAIMQDRATLQEMQQQQINILRRQEMIAEMRLTQIPPAETAPTTGPATLPASGPAAASTTQPATAPEAHLAEATTLPTTRPTTAALATTNPTSEPSVTSTEDVDDKAFAKSANEIIAAALKSDVDHLVKEIAGSIHDEMKDQWNAYRAHAIVPTTGPSTNPSTHPSAALAEATGARPSTQETTAATNPSTKPATHAGKLATTQPYNNPEKYLDALAKDIQAKHGVPLRVAILSSDKDWLTAKDLASTTRLPGIGGESLAAIAAKAAAFKKDPADNSQPSDVIDDASGNAYVYRIIDASPAHSEPLGDKDVHARVEEDTRVKLAYEAARAKAEKFRDRVAKGENFNTLARAQHKNPLQTPYFNQSDTHAITPPELAQAGADLLAQASETNPHPVKIAEIPLSRKVLVAQLANVKLQVPDKDSAKSLEEFRYNEKLKETARQEAEMAKTLANYFSLDSVYNRLGYKAEATASNGQ